MAHLKAVQVMNTPRFKKAVIQLLAMVEDKKNPKKASNIFHSIMKESVKSTNSANEVKEKPKSKPNPKK